MTQIGYSLNTMVLTILWGRESEYVKATDRYKIWHMISEKVSVD